MRLEKGKGLTRGARYLSLGLVSSAIGVLLILASVGATNAQSGVVQQHTINNDFSSIVYPMVISVSGVSMTGEGPGQTISIGLNAGNNLALEPNYASATVKLQSLSLVLKYSSASAGVPLTVVNLNPTESVAISTNNNQTFSVSTGGNAIPAGAVVSVEVDGNYSWQLHATVTDSNGTYDRVVNGQGMVSQYAQEVTVG